jgi:hypothetical protein
MGNTIAALSGSSIYLEEDIAVNTQASLQLVGNITLTTDAIVNGTLTLGASTTATSVYFTAGLFGCFNYIMHFK